MAETAGTGDPLTELIFTPDPDNPGWLVRPALKTGRFLDIFGEMRVLVESDRQVRCRIDTGPQHRNLNQTLHGGFMLAFVDLAIFVAPKLLGVEGALGGVTLDSSAQFFVPFVVGKPIDAVVEVLRVTGRMIFVRGLIEQDGVTGVAFSATIRRAPRA